MKKILLLAALAGTMAPAFAEGFSDSFKLKYEGEELKDGQTITVDKYYDPIIVDYPELNGPDWNYEYEGKAEIFATNISEEPKQLEFSLNIVEPSADDFSSGKYGNYQLCYFFETGSGNCLSQDRIANFVYPNDPVGAEEYIRLDVDHVKFTDLTPVTLKLDLRVMEDGDVAGTSTIYVKFTHQYDVTMAVEGIEAANANAEYFTLQGIRVAEPQKGQLVIERRGGKVTKRIF